MNDNYGNEIAEAGLREEIIKLEWHLEEYPEDLDAAEELQNLKNELNNL